MKYYKTQNGIRAIGEKGDIDGDQSKLVQKDWIEISYDEMLAITNPPKTAEELLQEQINEYKQYLTNTDHKFLNGYVQKEDEDLEAIAVTRNSYREFIRLNKGDANGI